MVDTLPLDTTDYNQERMRFRVGNKIYRASGKD